MPRLVEGLSRFFGRVEILARGAENDRRAAEEALSRGRVLEAREFARELLAKVPESPLGLALWADAAEEAWLDHEVVEALSALSQVAPWRADVWLRLGRAGLRIDWGGARDALERAAAAPEERDSARLALLDLCDLDLSAGDPGRAARWLDRIPPSLGGAPDRELALRRAECSLALGDLAAATTAAELMGEGSVIDGRAALVHARLLHQAGDARRAAEHATRAFVLDAQGAADVLASIVAGCRDAVIVGEVRRVIEAAGRIEEPAWAAAFAFAEGRRADARRALERGVEQGDRAAASALVRLALETRDLDALRLVAERDPGSIPEELRTLREAALARGEGRGAVALDLLDGVSGDAGAWADDARREVVADWIPAATGEAAPSPAAWQQVIQELRRTARALDRVDLAVALEALAVERERPLRVAVVGEFNAGKSTFLNALLGTDVAPTGVLPTTATLHWVAWAPDPFARVVVRGAPDRVVPHAELKPTLRALRDAGSRVERVFIYAPLERLKRVEILDTPGFNAPDPEHIVAARQAFDEAHVAIWLLDATGPMKETERRVLAEIRGLGVPVQILVNKADRLAPGALEKVLDHIRTSLTEAGIESYAPPVAFSARLSLAGRLGDAAALEASHWADVEALLAERIVDASDELRERALRRKAGRIARELAEAARTRGADEQAAASAARARAAHARGAAAGLVRERTRLAGDLDRGTQPARRLLAADLRPLREIEGDRRIMDPALRAYVVERFVERLSAAILPPIAAATGLELRPIAASAARAVLAGAAAARDVPADLAESPLERVFEAAIEAYANALVAELDQPVPQPSGTALERRAAALVAALDPKPPPSAR